MFQKNLLGELGKDLPADAQGWVPEVGDEPDSFNWKEMTDWTKKAPEEWVYFVQKVVAPKVIQALRKLCIAMGDTTGLQALDSAEEISLAAEEAKLSPLAREILFAAHGTWGAEVTEEMFLEEISNPDSQLIAKLEYIEAISEIDWSNPHWLYDVVREIKLATLWPWQGDTRPS